MTAWCPICREWIDPEWSTGAQPVPYHLLGRSMHAVQADALPLRREMVVRERGEYVTVGPPPLAWTATVRDLLTNPVEEED